MANNNGYTSAEKNHALCRKDLDFIPNGNFISNGYEESQNMQFFKVNGLTRFWETEQDFSVSTLVGDILNSSVRHGVPFAYAIIGNENGIDIYIGTMKVLRDGLRSSYESVFPGIDIEYVSENPLRTSPREYGGMFTGIPTDKLAAEKKSFQIENICRGMQGKNFTYLILASGISNIAVTLGHEKILEEMESVFTLINQTISGGAQGNLSAQKQDFHSKNYFENLEFCTIAENNKHARENGLVKYQIGSECNKAKLRDEEVRKIRDMYKTGMYTQKEIADMFNIKPDSVCLIVHNKIYVNS